MYRIFLAFVIAACAHMTPPTTAAITPQVRTTPPGQYFTTLVDGYTNPKTFAYIRFYYSSGDRTFWRCPVIATCYERLGQNPNRLKEARCVDYGRCAVVDKASSAWQTVIDYATDCLLAVEARTDKRCEQGDGACDRAEVWNEHARHECFERNAFDPN